MIQREFLTRILVSAAWLLASITGQQIGVDLCACQPAVYSVRLQFNLTCSDATIAAGLPGIEDTTCLVDKSTDANLTDFVPTMINEIQFFETDQAGNIVRQNLFAEGYVDGDVLNYTSFLLSDAIDAVSLPSALSVFATGQNAAGEPIINTWAIEFTNDCAVHPVITAGQRIGWTVFVSAFDSHSSITASHSSFSIFSDRTTGSTGRASLVPAGQFDAQRSHYHRSNGNENGGSRCGASDAFFEPRGNFGSSSDCHYGAGQYDCQSSGNTSSCYDYRQPGSRENTRAGYDDCESYGSDNTCSCYYYRQSRGREDAGSGFDAQRCAC
jgi:hypothetical protein